MVHGDCSSRGCYAMTDEQIRKSTRSRARSFFGGQKAFQLQAYPFRMTAMFIAVMRNGKACTWNARWPPKDDLARERVDFLDLLVGHRVAAARRAGAMHHQIRAGAPKRAVEGVRKAEC